MRELNPESDSLWTAMERINPLYLTRAMSWFEVMNRARGDHYDAVRDRVDQWWQAVEVEKRKDIGRKLCSGRDDAAHAALAELFLMNEFVKYGFKVSQSNLKTLTPDIRCENTSGQRFVVEVATLNPNAESVKERKRIDALLDALDNPLLERSRLPKAMLQVCTWRVGKSTAPSTQIVDRVHKWLRTAETGGNQADSRSNAIQEEESTLWWIKGPATPTGGRFFTGSSTQSVRHEMARQFANEGQQWVVSFNFIPIVESELEDYSLNGRVGITSTGHAKTLPATRLPKVVFEKTKKYGRPCREAELPLIVAVGDPEWLNPAHHDLQRLNQVFHGTLVQQMDLIEGNWVGKELVRTSDGLWNRKQAQWLSGVLIINSQRWQWGEFSITGFSKNPEIGEVRALDPIPTSWLSF